MAREEEMREKALQYEFLRQQSDAIEKQLGELESKTQELVIIKQSIEEIKGQEGKELLVPVGSGVFLKGKLLSDSDMLVELGADVVAEKSAEETIEVIESQIEEIDRIKNQMRDDMIKNISRMRQLEPEISRYYSQKR